MTDKKINKKKMNGIVVSDKMTDTAVVMVERYVKHTKYKKYQKIRKKFSAHDAGNTKKIGDKVVIEETRPISKTKKFKIIA